MAGGSGVVVGVCANLNPQLYQFWHLKSVLYLSLESVYYFTSEAEFDLICYFCI